MWLIAALTFASGVVVAVRMRETMRGRVDGGINVPAGAQGT